MPETIQEIAAGLVEKVARDLIAAAEATPEERATWEPADGGARSMLNQLAECCLANAKWTAILRTQAFANLPEEVAAQTYRELDTIPKATQRLRESASRLAGVIRSLSDHDLETQVPLPWKDGVSKSLAVCCFHPYWNMVYHEGQINYIQTLYGDYEEHSDSGPFGD